VSGETAPGGASKYGAHKLFHVFELAPTGRFSNRLGGAELKVMAEALAMCASDASCDEDLLVRAAEKVQTSELNRKHERLAKRMGQFEAMLEANQEALAQANAALARMEALLSR
jgi:hypothetical protein